MGEQLTDQSAASSAWRPQVSQLDQAIWTRLRTARDRAVFVDAWLALQCRMLGGVQQAAVVLGEPDTGPYAPVAFWPEEATDATALSGVAELAMTEARGVIQAGSQAEGFCHVAYPLTVDGQLHGVIALQIDQRPERQLRQVMRQLQWGASWIELMLHRERADATRAMQERVAAALDLIAVALEQERFAGACTAIATELATRLGCDRVSIGFVHRRQAKVVGLSHSAEIVRNMNLIRAIGHAMDEAIDQETALLRTEAGTATDGPWVTRAHAELLRHHGAAAVLSVPLTVGERTVGAITLEHHDPAGFSQDRVELAEAVAAVVGPILEEKRANDRLLIGKIGTSLWTQAVRLLGPGYPGRKLAVLTLAGIVAFFAWYETGYRVTADAMLEGQVRRVVAAPFNGYVSAVAARPGDVVRKDEVLARLDDRDLVLERLGLVAQRRQRQLEYDAALARGERAELNILDAQIGQIDAQIALVEAQLARASIVAPFDGLVVSGDLSQSIGAAVERGEQLFEVAPLDDYRVVLQVDERDVTAIAIGQTGDLRSASMPDRAIPFTVSRITPVAEASDGRNRFRVEGTLAPDAFGADGRRLLPGMKGVGKIEAGERRLIWIWTHRAVEWLRLWLWTWLP